MTRWMILLGSVALWAAIMWAVYDQYGPKPPSADALANASAMAAVLDEQAPTRRGWDIYLNMEEVAGPNGQFTQFLSQRLTDEWRAEFEKKKGEAFVAGAEPNEIKVGELVSTIKRRGFTRATVTTDLRLTMPQGFSGPAMKLINNAQYHSSSQVSRDLGVEDVSVRVKLGVATEVIAHGIRDQNKFNVNVGVYQGQEKMIDEKSSVPMNGPSMPQVDFSPFYYRPSIKLGEAWEAAMVNMHSTSGATQMYSVQMKVVERLPIQYLGHETYVYKVEGTSNRGACTAYYSLDGVVLKQRIKLFDLVDATLIRHEELR